MGVDDDDGVSVPARSLLLELVADDVLHECGLAHAGAGDVEVVSSQQVGGEVNLPGRSGGGVADVGAAADAAGGGQQHLRPGAGHQGRLVPRSGRVPQAGRLADAHDAALAEQAGAGRMEHGGVGHGGPHAARLQVRPCGVVVVAVGGGHRLQQLLRPVGPGVLGQDGRHLNLGVEGDAGDLLLDEKGVEDPLSGLLDAVPEPAACGQGCGDANAHDHGLPGVSRLHPQVAPEGDQRRHAQHGHRHAVHLEGSGLVGVGGVSPVLHGPLVGLLQVRLRPVGSQGPQHQPGHDALTLVEVGESAHEGDEGV